jgi:ABC-type antimicrobial peptide transport system permease subunit
MKETPQAGAFGTIATFLFGTMLQFDKAMQNEITFWLQTSAFVISLIVGILTICISIRKIKQRDGKN